MAVMGPSPEGHRDFVDALRDALGLAPLYGPDEPSPIATYPDVGRDSFESAKLTTGEFNEP